MNFILYSDVNDRSISQSLGRPEYSYYFVLKAYRPVLESLGRVHVVSTSAEVDPLYRQLLAAGESSVFLSLDVCCWPIADTAIALTNVRFWSKANSQFRRA